ncbi:MAG: hypothetical protein K2X66_02800 [Cyanobacteria bacterium]|nr:hypothetical protein [Cyanobacteriota bacterium]
MSITLKLIPFGLAMKAILGKEQFEQWQESQQIEVPTHFTHQQDLLTVLKQSGWDATPIGQSFKSHLQPSNSPLVKSGAPFLMWEFRERSWVALYSKKDEALIAGFQQALEKASGQSIFKTPPSALLDTPNIQTFPTLFTDKALLMETLNTFGAHPIIQQGPPLIISCVIQQTQLNFTQTSPNEAFSLTIPHAPDLRSLYPTLKQLDALYGNQVQKMVYHTLKNNIEAQHLHLENEEVLEDNSIRITLTIND